MKTRKPSIIFEKSINIVNRDLEDCSEIMQASGSITQDDLEHLGRTRNSIYRIGLHACIPETVPLSDETLAKIYFHPSLARLPVEAISSQVEARTGQQSHYAAKK